MSSRTVQGVSAFSAFVALLLPVAVGSQDLVDLQGTDRSISQLQRLGGGFILPRPKAWTRSCLTGRAKPGHSNLAARAPVQYVSQFDKSVSDRLVDP